MKKIAIFNVGGALSSYLEFDDVKMVIDLGSGNGFSPVDDFLIPLATKKFTKLVADKFFVDQLFISHLDMDHISDYEKFRKQFHPDWMTCPNDNEKLNNNNEKQDENFKVDISLLGEENSTRQLVLEDMRCRQPLSSSEPLKTKCESVGLYFIKPKECENAEDLKNCYANNISLVLLIQFDKKNLLMPGDIQKEGMKYLIENNEKFRLKLNNEGIDYLVAPHHGLQTSFSELLFQEINGNKTRLNIISEKIREADSDENRTGVDGRYYSSDYSTGENTLKQNGIKTSGGHIVIDFSTEEAEIKVINDVEDLIKEFVD